MFVRVPGTIAAVQGAQKEECLSVHTAVSPEDEVVMAENVQCFTLETARHQCQCLWTLHFLYAVMFCQCLGMQGLVLCLFVCAEASLCIGRWLGKSTANITALEKCFCSQTAWQKWQLIQVPVYLSQVINFSPIKKRPLGRWKRWVH